MARCNTYGTQSRFKQFEASQKPVRRASWFQSYIGVDGP